MVITDVVLLDLNLLSEDPILFKIQIQNTYHFTE